MMMMKEIFIYGISSTPVLPPCHKKRQRLSQPLPLGCKDGIYPFAEAEGVSLGTGVSLGVGVWLGAGVSSTGFKLSR